MFDLRRNEIIILVCLLAALLVGLILSVYIKSHTAADVKITTFEYDLENSRIKLDINEASVDELTCLPGIGKVLAGRIVEYRSQKGSFSSTEDIKNVKGVGQSLFDKIKDDIVVR